MKNLPSVIQIVVRAETPLNPSEDLEKVSTAVSNVLDDCIIDSKHGKVIGRSIGSEALNTIYKHVRSKAALGVLRKALLANRMGDATWFLLNKQAAAAGTVALVENKEESPLGAIKITVESEELDKVIEWLAPKVRKFELDRYRNVTFILI
jgi:predicted RNA binding protein with dsRBD fold (UPF0201 family)